jgi:hypothetical protein
MSSRLLITAAAGAWLLSGCMYISGVEFVQAVQTPDNGVPMVAVKPTFVRVYVRASEAWHGPWNLDARLVVRDETTATEHELAPLNHTPIVAPPNVDRGQWGQSFTFMLDRIDTFTGTRTFTVRVFEVGTASPRVETLVTPWTFHPVVYNHAYGVVWAVTNNNDGMNAPIGPAAPWSDYAGHVDYVRNVSPVTDFAVVPLPGIGYVAPNPQNFGNLTESRNWADQMRANLPAGSKVNLLDNWDTGGLHGFSFGYVSEEQNARTDGRIGATMAHEISHTNGLWCHTFDICELYPSFPRKSGLIDVHDIGFNISRNYGHQTPQLVTFGGQFHSSGFQTVEAPTGDLMSYVFPQWISSYTYCTYISMLWRKEDAACSYANTPSAAGVPGDLHVYKDVHYIPKPDLKPEPPEPMEMVFVAGVVGKDGRATFNAFERVTRAAERLHGNSEASYLRVDVLASDGTVLGSAPIAASREDAIVGTPFSALLPATLLTTRAAKLRLREGERTLTERTLDTQAPGVALEAMRDIELSGRIALNWRGTGGDTTAMKYTLLFSADNGRYWWPLQVALSASNIVVNTEFLPGTERGLFKVRASNFGYTTDSAAIGPYRIAAKPPRVTIDAPLAGARLEPGQHTLVRASAHSWQHGMLTDTDTIAWELDGKPVDAKGPWWVARTLGAGEHVLKAIARDPDGLSGEASVRFIVAAPADAAAAKTQ